MSRYKATVAFGPINIEFTGEINMKHIEDRGRDEEALERLNEAFPRADYIHIEWEYK